MTAASERRRGGGGRPHRGAAQEGSQLVVAFSEDILTNDPQRAFEFYSGYRRQRL